MEGKLRIMTEATAGSNKIWPAGGRRNQIGDRCHLVGHSTTLPPDTFYNKDREGREGFGRGYNRECHAKRWEAFHFS